MRTFVPVPGVKLIKYNVPLLFCSIPEVWTLVMRHDINFSESAIIYFNKLVWWVSETEWAIQTGYCSELRRCEARSLREHYYRSQSPELRTLTTPSSRILVITGDVLIFYVISVFIRDNSIWEENATNTIILSKRCIFKASRTD